GGVGVNPNTNKIYGSTRDCCLGNGSIYVIDGSTNKVVNTITVGINPFDVAVNPNTNRIYAANSADGTVTVIQGSPGPTSGEIQNLINIVNGMNLPQGITHSLD